MKRLTFAHIAAVAFIALAALPGAAHAKALPVHSVWAQKPLYVAEGGAWYTPVRSDAAISWQAWSGYAFANARAFIASGDMYEFMLTGVAATSSDDQIDGYWNVSKNGVLLCAGCTGSAYGLSQPMGNYFKIYVSGSFYHFSGYITNRYDY